MNTSFGIVETLIPRQKPTIAPNKRTNETEIDLAGTSATKKAFTQTTTTTTTAISVSSTVSTTRKTTPTQSPSTSATSTTLAVR